jgi:hypothetical protein
VVFHFSWLLSLPTRKIEKPSLPYRLDMVIMAVVEEAKLLLVVVVAVMMDLWVIQEGFTVTWRILDRWGYQFQLG